MGANHAGFRRLFLASLVAQVGLAGCGSGDGLSRHPISGTVTFDGKPLANGFIQFLPSADSATPIAAGAMIEGGNYAIPTEEGLVAGSYQVMISSAGSGKEKASGGGEASGEGAMPGLGPLHARELIPPKYNTKSELTATVTDEGPNEFDFNLEKSGGGDREGGEGEEEVSQEVATIPPPSRTAPARGEPLRWPSHPCVAKGPDPVPAIHHSSHPYFDSGSPTDGTSSSRVHIDRAPRRHRDHRGPDRPPLARRPGGGEAARRAQCVNNLKQIGLAMHNYADSNSVLPPGHRTAVFGTFQTFILPYLEQSPLSNAYNHEGRYWAPGVTSGGGRARPTGSDTGARPT